MMPEVTGGVVIDEAGLPDEFVRAARIGGLWKPLEPESPVTSEERQQLRAALALLDDDERFVLTHRFGLDGCERLTNRAIWQARGWKSNRTMDVQRRALRRLAETVYVPVLPAIGQWVRIIQVGSYGEPALGTPLRVVGHKDRYTIHAAVALPYRDHEGRDIVTVGHQREGDEAWFTLQLSEVTQVAAADAVPYALAIPDPLDRADALIGLASHLAPAERPPMFYAAAAALALIHKPADHYTMTRCLACIGDLPTEALEPAALAVVDYLIHIVPVDEAVPFIAWLRTHVPAAYQQLLRKFAEHPDPSPRGRQLYQRATAPQQTQAAEELRRCLDLASTAGAPATEAVLRDRQRRLQVL